ncbi:globin [Cytophagaceae bacterium ABcell3]|nr:globin [Cytophagaceae bacterium ABcell3]
MDKTVYERLGAENLKLLVDKFYDLVFADPDISHLFSRTPKEEIKKKQYMFLTQFLGGPSLYSEAYGHPRMRARHMPHEISEDSAVAWLKCMHAAIQQLPVDEQLKEDLFNRFPQTAFFMVNKQ